MSSRTNENGNPTLAWLQTNESLVLREYIEWLRTERNLTPAQIVGALQALTDLLLHHATTKGFTL